MSEIHRQRLRRYKFEFWFVGNDRRPSQKSGMRRGKIGTLPILQICPRPSRIIGHIYDRFRVFISRQNLGQPGSSKIPDCLGFSRHMKTRLNGKTSIVYSISFCYFICRRTPLKRVLIFWIKVSGGDWLWKSANIKSWKQRCCSLCWKLPYCAVAFVFCPQIVTE